MPILRRLQMSERHAAILFGCVYSKNETWNCNHYLEMYEIVHPEIPGLEPLSLNGSNKSWPICLFQNHMTIFRLSARLRRSTLRALLITWYSLRTRDTVAWNWVDAWKWTMVTSDVQLTSYQRPTPAVQVVASARSAFQIRNLQRINRVPTTWNHILKRASRVSEVDNSLQIATRTVLCLSTGIFAFVSRHSFINAVLLSS
jgi:hypothetical protein